MKIIILPLCSELFLSTSLQRINILKEQKYLPLSLSFPVLWRSDEERRGENVIYFPRNTTDSLSLYWCYLLGELGAVCVIKGGWKRSDWEESEFKQEFQGFLTCLLAYVQLRTGFSLLVWLSTRLMWPLGKINCPPLGLTDGADPKSYQNTGNTLSTQMGVGYWSSISWCWRWKDMEVWLFCTLKGLKCNKTQDCQPSGHGFLPLGSFIFCALFHSFSFFPSLVGLVYKSYLLGFKNTPFYNINPADI